jgi:hypothetical protein
MPPLCTPLIYAEQMVPERWGSSEKLSKLCMTKRMYEFLEPRRWSGCAKAHTAPKRVLENDINI